MRGDLRQDLFGAAVRTRTAQLLGELLEHAIFESIHHRFVHVALGADRRRIAEVVRSLANGVEHLPPPGAFASRRRGAGERVEHRDGSEQRAEILERNFDARDLAQKAVDVVRARLAQHAVFAAILKEAAAGQLPEHGDRGRKPRRMHLLLDPLGAFGAEAQTNGLAVDRDVRLEQCRRAARAAQPRILLAARTYGAARDEIDDGR
jgi:hypothetical protein